MEALRPLEEKMAEVFKGVPQLSNSVRKTLGDILPWLALIGGILQVWSAFSLWRLYDQVDEVVDGLNDWARTFGVDTNTHDAGVFFWVSLVMLAVVGVLLLVAFPALRQRQKKGWDLVFLTGVINIVVAFLYLFMDSYYRGGVGSFIMTLVFSAVSFYLLFQVRGEFGGAALPNGDKAKTTKTDKK